MSVHTQAYDSAGAVKLLIVDDHPLFAAGFMQMAGTLRPGWTVLSVASAAEALALLAASERDQPDALAPDLAPDLAIIDVGLPDEDGFSLLRALLEIRPDLPAILISGRDDAATLARARASSAAGFIAKTASPGVIVEMVENVLAGGQAFGDESPGGALPVLTPRQAEVLALLAEGHANKEIRHRLGIAERTVRAHLTELFHVLGANSRMQAVIRGRALGLIGQ